MSRIDDINREISEEARKLENAVNTEDKAAKAAKDAKKRIQKLEAERKQLEEERVILNDPNVIYVEPSEEEAARLARESKQVVVYEEKANGKEKDGRFVSGLLIGAAAIILVGAGYKIVKDGRFQWLKPANNSKTLEDTDTSKTSTSVTNNNYDYENNEYVIVDNKNETTKPAVSEEIVVDNKAEETNYNFNYTGSVITSDSNYVVLDEAKFEELTADTIQTLEGYGLKVSREDIVKYVMIRNIDKLRQDNNELIDMVVGSQDPVEAFADADHVIDAIMTYNLLYFLNNHNTDGFISASVGVFDETQKARVLEIEKRVYEIGANYNNEEKYNELTHQLLRDMLDPTKEISELEDGVSYGVEWIDMYMVRSTFGTDEFIKLSDENAEFVKYFVSFAGDGVEYENNAVVNGNVRNINALLNECTNTKTRTK